MNVVYAREPDLSANEFADVLHRSTLAERRPVDAEAVLDSALEVLRERVDALGVRIEARGLGRRSAGGLGTGTDLAVDAAFQRQGIGRRLIELTHQHAGKHTTLILLSAPAAREYYPHIGMQQHDSCWILKAAFKS